MSLPDLAAHLRTLGMLKRDDAREPELLLQLANASADRMRCDACGRGGVSVELADEADEWVLLPSLVPPAAARFRRSDWSSIRTLTSAPSARNKPNGAKPPTSTTTTARGAAREWSFAPAAAPASRVTSKSAQPVGDERGAGFQPAEIHTTTTAGDFIFCHSDRSGSNDVRIAAGGA